MQQWYIVGRFDPYPVPTPSGKVPIGRLASSCELIDAEVLALGP